MISVAHYGTTHVGWRRKNNEDSFTDFSEDGQVVLAVADGLGGHAQGEIASALAISEVRSWTDSSLRGLAEKAHLAIVNEAYDRNNNMGCTLTVVRVDDAGRAELMWVGDSRAYLLRDSKLECLSTDDNAAQMMYADGVLTYEQAQVHPSRHQLVQALGMQGFVRPHLEKIDLKQGDRLLLCSDGLNGELNDEQIESLLWSALDAKSAAEALISATLDTEANDNVTVVAAFIE